MPRLWPAAALAFSLVAMTSSCSGGSNTAPPTAPQPPTATPTAAATATATATPPPTIPADVEKAASDIERMLKLGDDSVLAMGFLIGAKWQIRGVAYLEAHQRDADAACQEVLSKFVGGQPADLWPRDYTAYRDTLYVMCGAFSRLEQGHASDRVVEGEYAGLRQRRAALPDYSAAQLRRALLARK